MKLVLLWHQHQPPYRHPVSGLHVMSWVRLHALKDYYDMVRTVLDAPERVRVVVNLSPALLEQLEELVADPFRDQMLAVCRRNNRDRSPAEREWLIRELFSVHHETMLAPHRRYRALLQRYHEGVTFSRQDRIDLQVLFHLAWSGVSLRRDPFVAGLIRKGRGYTIAERSRLLELQEAHMAMVIPIHREAALAGRIEVSTSPYHHPILPLVCSTLAASEAEPDIQLPETRFRYGEDADRHIQRALAMHERLFGARPAGMWPAEGAVSEEAVARMAAHGVRWVATDESVLARSLGGEPGGPDDVWQWGNVAIFFRNHELSDRIGFVYSRWDPDHAADDFVARVRERGASSSSEDPVVTVALDGENAWEHFAGGGYDFLAAMYKRLADASDIEMVTPAGWLRDHVPRPLPRLAPGTWIDGSFRTWMGDPVKNRAWDLLAHARATLALTPPSRVRDDAMEAVLRAEASDWFWWFGEGHSTDHDAQFDALFRAHVAAVYRALGIRVPGALLEPLGATRPEEGELRPTRCDRPPITGEPSPYYKWSAAAHRTLQQGSIHRFDPLLLGAWAVYDHEALSLRLDTRGRAEKLLRTGHVFELLFTEPEPSAVRIEPGCVLGQHLGVAVGTVVEIALPVRPGQRVSFCWRVLKDEAELERFPWVGELCLDLRGPRLDLENWMV